MSESNKLIIGLTGNIATGKSAVMRLAAEAGALTIDADKLVHELMGHDADIQAAVADAFGPDVRRPDGRIDRQALGQIVFADKNAMRKLEQLLHPAVQREIARRMEESDAQVVMIEAIKLLEGSLAEACHQVWVTRCKKQRQLERLRICRGMDTDSAVARIRAQSPQEAKVARADVVIDTNGLMTDTEKQFQRAWARLPHPADVEPKRVTAPPPIVKPKKAAPTVKRTIVPRPQTGKIKPRADGVKVRRARPSDIPSILLLIQKATDGAVKMKRAELLRSFSERSYFIGQKGVDISTVVGWNIESQIARIDQMYLYPPEGAGETGAAVLEEIEKSANSHICEMIAAFLPADASDDLLLLFDTQGYGVIEKEGLPRAWQSAIEESQPENTFFMIKVLRDHRIVA
ncbi:MAG: dephospho-CoA kinase [Anaerolineae bacterium]